MKRLVLTSCLVIATASWVIDAPGQEAPAPGASLSEKQVATSRPAKDTPHGRQSQERVRARERARERWEKMSPDQRRQLLEHYKRWNTMSQEERMRVRENYERWKNMSGDQQRKLRRRMNNMNEMPESQRREMQRRMEMLRQLPPERQRLIAAFLRRLKQMPPEQLEQLRRLPIPQRKQALQKILREAVRELGHTPDNVPEKPRSPQVDRPRGRDEKLPERRRRRQRQEKPTPTEPVKPIDELPAT